MTAPDVFHLSLAFHTGRSSIPPETPGFRNGFFGFILLPTHCFFPFPVVLSLFSRSLKGSGTSPLVLLAHGTPQSNSQYLLQSLTQELTLLVYEKEAALLS